MVLVSRKIVLKVWGSLFLCIPLWSFAQNTLVLSRTPSLKSSIVKSILVPGLGEFSLGKINRGRLFSQIELALWLTFAESRRRASLTESTLQSFAAIHAGAKLEQKSDRYYVDIGNYESMEAYNEAQQRYREPGEVYSKQAGFDWKWDKEMNRRKYRRYRIQKNTARMVSQFAIGGMILNRIISVIDVRYLVKASHSKSRITIQPFMENNACGAQLRFAYLF